MAFGQEAGEVSQKEQHPRQREQAVQWPRAGRGKVGVGAGRGAGMGTVVIRLLST